MTKPARDPVAGGVAALRQLTREDSSAGDVTRARLLDAVQRGRRRSSAARRMILLVVLPLVASTALAATFVGRAVWTRRTAALSQQAAARPRSPGRPPAALAPHQVPPPQAASPGPLAAAAPSVSDADGDLDAYGAAHRAHFAGRDFARALRLWNAYLRDFPRGRFVPEATYNRAITLVRLGHRRQALTALRPLAAGRFDGYRQPEARALLEALQQE